jgi:hypothetical protein
MPDDRDKISRLASQPNRARMPIIVRTKPTNKLRLLVDCRHSTASLAGSTSLGFLPDRKRSGLVEADGFEPTTYGLQSRRSPN